MKNKKWWNGFLIGYFIGGLFGVIVMGLVQRGVL
jgi:hypothetical protein